MLDIISKGNNVILASEDKFETVTFVNQNSSANLEIEFARIQHKRFDQYYGKYFQDVENEQENRVVILLLTKKAQRARARVLEGIHLSIDFPQSIRVYYGKEVYCDICKYSGGNSDSLGFKSINLVMTLLILLFALACLICGIKIFCLKVDRNESKQNFAEQYPKNEKEEFSKTG